MKNIFVTGSGRSGTSMLAGLFSKAGYYYGDNVYSPRNANPKGFFEDAEINKINENIIFNSLMDRGVGKDAIRFLHETYEGQLWLFRAPDKWTFKTREEERSQIQDLVNRQPFCFKDPRFCFTLENWLECENDSVVLCVYRDPGVTVESILRECKTAPYLYSANLGVNAAYEIWSDMYLRLLRLYIRHENIYFVNYDDILSGKVFPGLEELTGVDVDHDFPDTKFSRSQPSFEKDYRANLIYEVLQAISGSGLAGPSREKFFETIRALDKKLITTTDSLSGLNAEPKRVDEIAEIVTSNIYKKKQSELAEANAENAFLESKLDSTAENYNWERTQFLDNEKTLRIELDRREKEIHSKDREIKNRDQVIENKDQETKNRDQEIKNRDQVIENKDHEIEDKDQEIKQLKVKVGILEKSIAAYSLAISDLQNSTSWRVTAPLRLASVLLGRVKLFFGVPKRVVTNKKHEDDIEDSNPWEYPDSLPENENHALIVEMRIPTPDKTSGSVRLSAILDLVVEMGYRVTFISYSTKDQYHWIFKEDKEFEPHEKRLASMGVEIIYGVDAGAKHLASHGYRYSHVLLSYPDVAYKFLPWVRSYAVNAKVIFDTVDLHGLRFRREAELKNDPELGRRADYYDKIEKLCIECSDQTIAITENEKELILQYSPDATVGIIPNIHTTSQTLTQFSERENLLFIGHYLHAPNQDAVKYFVNEILPLIHKKLPGVKFTMLGSSITDEVKALAGDYVEAVGYVEDPAPYFSSHRVFVSPLRYGAGMKGKIGQSLSLGLPMVTTTIGAEGMGIENSNQALIADDEASFADAVVALYTDEELWRRIATNGIAHIEKNYSYEVVRKSIKDVISPIRIEHKGVA
jgi:glycosyltransferase involved in cell wall biosynthesis